MQRHTGLLGDFSVGREGFSDLDLVFERFKTEEFRRFPDRKRSDRVNRELLALIEKESEPCFLLSHVLEFVERIDREKILHHYTFTSFELWLNLASALSFEENYRVRAKIAGKWIERGDYQILFPIGMGKIYEGTHFITAHKSPDLDTTVASFWGWMDAFAARVTRGLHVWNVPGGPPSSQIEIDWIFRDLFGGAVFTHLPKTRSVLSVTGNDLLSETGFIRTTLDASLASIDHEREKNAVVLVDEEGFYLGDWRHLDVESVQQVIILLSTCIRWFENQLHLSIISLFAKKVLHLDEIRPLLQKLFGLCLQDCEPAKEFSLKQKQLVSQFLSVVLGLKEGFSLTFEQLGAGLAALHEGAFQTADQIVQEMQDKKMFDASGVLLEDRPKIFHFLEKTVKTLHETIFKIRSRLERLDIALKTKQEVFGHRPTFVTVWAEEEEIREKMKNYSYLTVAYPAHGRFFPIGVIHASDIRKACLGTVSLRDFCNREEMGIPPYLEVISVIDHHKSTLTTCSAPLAIIADAQSSNSLVADRAIAINDRYSLLGQSPSVLDEQIVQRQNVATPLDQRLLMRLLQRRQASETKGDFYVHPKREFVEYLHFLYAILDDTDLLSKVSVMDVEIVIQLLNRLKSIASQEEVEVIHVGDLARDEKFAKKAAQRILQNEEMYSLYRQVYAYREQEVNDHLLLMAEKKPSNLFADTKEQNGCCRVGQTKLFAKNVVLFEKYADQIRRAWLEKAKAVYAQHAEIDLHIHMISTIVSAEEVYQGKQSKYPHRDEMWIWTPGTEVSLAHLKNFAANFKNSPGLKNNTLALSFLGRATEELLAIFAESFLNIPTEQKKELFPDQCIIVLTYQAGTLNSRKAMVSPFLPLL
jgi:hypothetical protein